MHHAITEISNALAITCTFHRVASASATVKGQLVKHEHLADNNGSVSRVVAIVVQNSHIRNAAEESSTRLQQNQRSAHAAVFARFAKHLDVV